MRPTGEIIEDAQPVKAFDAFYSFLRFVFDMFPSFLGASLAFIWFLDDLVLAFDGITLVCQ